MLTQDKIETQMVAPLSAALITVAAISLTLLNFRSWGRGGPAENLRKFYEHYWRDGLRRGNPQSGQNRALIGKTLKAVAVGRPLKETRVLDAGCAGGEYLAFLREFGVSVVAVDIASAAIENTIARCPGAQLVQASFEVGLPFADKTFDAVWFGETIAHLFDAHAILTEFNRVLRTEGTLILTTPYHGLVKNLFIVLFEFERHFYPSNYRIRFFNRATLDAALRRAGFSPLSWHRVGGRPPLWELLFVVARKSGVSGPPPSRLDWRQDSA